MKEERDLFAWFSAQPSEERKRIVAKTYAILRGDSKASLLAQELIEKPLERPKAAICPIVREVEGRAEQFGSGVLIEIAGVKFLCTAAHVADEGSQCPLLIPGKDGFIQLTGHYGGMGMPASGIRKDDRYDIGYYRLDADCAAELHPTLMFLGWPDCELRDTTVAKNWYTLIGFPNREGRTSGNVVETSLKSLSGDGVADSRYQKLGKNIQHHLLVQFRRKKAMRYQNWSRSIVCLPEGMSGGGVFAWTKKMSRLEDIVQPKLVGIITDYDESRHVFAATRINCYINAIRKNNPDLPIYVGPSHNHGEIKA